MSHHCEGRPRTVGELVIALSALDPGLPLLEAWEGAAGWFEVDNRGFVILGVHGPCSRYDFPDFMGEAEIENDIRRGLL